MMIRSKALPAVAGSRNRTECQAQAFRILQAQRAPYAIGAAIGQGAQATVHLAVLANGEPYPPAYAAKVLRNSNFGGAQQEINILHLLDDCQNIATLVDTIPNEDLQAAGSVALILELCLGGMLLERAQWAPLGELEAAKHFSALVHVLVHCHQLGVMHRDLKLENIMFTLDGDIRVIDFGLATFAQPGQQLHELVGSGKYIAPEVWRKNYSFGADVWSLGVVLYAMLYREFPFDQAPHFWGEDMVLGAENDAAAAAAAAMLAPLEFPPGMSDLAENLLGSMLERDPARRPTAAQLLQHPWLIKHGYGITATEVQEHVIIQRLRLVSLSCDFETFDKSTVIVKCLCMDNLSTYSRTFD